MRTTLAALAVLFAVAGCTGSPKPVQPSPDPASAGPDASVTLVLLSKADLPPGSRVSLVPGGDAVDGQVTLDECGYTFTSEEARVARRQVDVAYPDEGTALYSNEVVAYDTSGHAELALQEWRSAVQRCPDDEFTKSAVAGIPDVRAELLEFHHLATLPISNNAVARQLLTTRKGRSLYVSVVYQQRGNLLDAHYLSTIDVPSEQQIQRLTQQARRTGERLATLPGGTGA